MNINQVSYSHDAEVVLKEHVTVVVNMIKSDLLCVDEEFLIDRSDLKSEVGECLV